MKKILLIAAVMILPVPALAKTPAAMAHCAGMYEALGDYYSYILEADEGVYKPYYDSRDKFRAAALAKDAAEADVAKAQADGKKAAESSFNSGAGEPYFGLDAQVASCEQQLTTPATMPGRGNAR